MEWIELVCRVMYIIFLLFVFYLSLNKIKEIVKLEYEEALGEEERLKELEERVDAISDYLFDKSEKNEKK